MADGSQVGGSQESVEDEAAGEVRRYLLMDEASAHETGTEIGRWQKHDGVNIFACDSYVSLARTIGCEDGGKQAIIYVSDRVSEKGKEEELVLKRYCIEQFNDPRNIKLIPYSDKAMDEAWKFLKKNKKK